MRKVESVLEPILDVVELEGASVIDVGCGTGDVARALSRHGARVIGIDRPEILARARMNEEPRTVRFLEGGAERIPVASESATLVLFLASLHHVPAAQMPEAMSEAYRVLSPGGQALFIEPLVECSYYLITRLVEDETIARRRAQEVIDDVGASGFERECEGYFYIERSFEDYRDLLDTYWEESEDRKTEILARAEAVARKLVVGADCTFGDYRFQSACRLDLLRKPRGE